LCRGKGELGPRGGASLKTWKVEGGKLGWVRKRKIGQREREWGYPSKMTGYGSSYHRRRFVSMCGDIAAGSQGMEVPQRGRGAEPWKFQAAIDGRVGGMFEIRDISISP